MTINVVDIRYEWVQDNVREHLLRAQDLIRAECSTKGLLEDLVYFYINEEDLVGLIGHPMLYSTSEGNFSKLLPFNYKVVTGKQSKGYITFYCNGVALDTHIFFLN